MKVARIVLTMLSLMALASCRTGLPQLHSADARTTTLLAVPTRYTLVQLSFDMVKIRPVTLLSYETDARARTVAVHIWDQSREAWRPITLEDYESGSLFRIPPARVLLVRDERPIPPELASAPSWARSFAEIRTFDFVEIVNAFHRQFDFSPGEWRWLADRYNLEIDDRNAERRQFGRYSRHDRDDAVQPPPVPPVEPETDVLEPAQLKESNAADSVHSEPEPSGEPIALEVVSDVQAEEKGNPLPEPEKPEHVKMETPSIPSAPPVTTFRVPRSVTTSPVEAPPAKTSREPAKENTLPLNTDVMQEPEWSDPAPEDK